jgi:hypothetical protein
MELDLTSLMKKVGAARAGIQARTGNNNTVKIPAGRSRWRVLPGWREADPGTFYHVFAQHWIKEPNPAGGEPLLKAVVVCESITFEKPCECCDVLSNIKTGMKGAGLTKEHSTWKQIDEMRGKRVYLLNMLRRDGDQKSDQPVMVGIPETCLNGYLTLFQTRAEEGINMLDLAAGKDIIIEKTGTGLNTEYSVTDAGTTSTVLVGLDGKPSDPMSKLINIDAYIEAERQKGATKVAMIGEATKKVISQGGGHSTLLIPSSASLVGTRPAQVAAPTPAAQAASRVIEADEVPFGATPAPVAAQTTAQPTQVTAPAPSQMVSEALLVDDELQKMLNDLK